MALVHIKDKADFMKVVGDGTIILMIHKEGCPYCDKAMPWMEEFADEVKDRVLVEARKDRIEEVMAHFNVQMYPTFVKLKDGVVMDVFFGDTQYLSLIHI